MPDRLERSIVAEQIAATHECECVSESMEVAGPAGALVQVR
jgi:hypothetical protein